MDVKFHMVTYTHYIYDLTDLAYTDGHNGVLEEAGGKQHNNTQAAPNKLKLGEGG